jgi:clorobiocin/coumermycin A biosynthesis protein CloN7/CouN7
MTPQGHGEESDLEMASSKSYTLDVPGARLYYEVQGSGPVLMLVGHPMGVTGFATIAPLLAEQFTVVAYDPRGFARSTIEDSDQDAEPELLADDVRSVLEAVGELPAHVFGSSGGAVTGLALVSKYPGHVATLIAHEPPVALLLPEAGKARAAIQEIYGTYHASGIQAAWERFSSFTGMKMRPPGGEAVPHPPSAEAVATSDRFFGHGLLPIALYSPDCAALQAVSARVIVAGGTTSKGEFAQRTAAALAQCLGTSLTEFPGGHAGFASDSNEFAAVLYRILA